MLSQPPDHLPERLYGLWEMAHNLWWSWHMDARNLFRGLDFSLWRDTKHNPVAILRKTDPDRLNKLAYNPSFLRRFDDVLARFRDDLNSYQGPIISEYGLDPDRPIAYFCAEFGLHGSVPMYSGGLGVLAGDHCREASDLHLPMVGVGLLYQKGYFRQRLKADGSQRAIPEVFDPILLPLIKVKPDEDADFITEVRVEDRLVRVAAWRINLGCVRVFLLDTDVEGNTPEDRELSAQLYSGDDRMRIRQEMILGIGGVRILRAMGINPSVWHLNEGHTAFLSLERLKEEIEGGKSFEDGSENVKRNSLFTTHTPIAAGHDRFSRELAQKALGYFMENAGIETERVFELATDPGDTNGMFSMSAFAIRTTGYCNAVSNRHGEVARRMWSMIWPERATEDVPIGHVTNGVHVANWLCHEMKELLTRHLGADWIERQSEPTLWDLVMDIPEEELWRVHMRRKYRVQMALRERVRRYWSKGELKTIQVVASGLLLDPDVLTIGFARRFATYKRANLIFRDMKRLKSLLLDTDRPIQFVLAGKAHPRDEYAQVLIQQVYKRAHTPSLAGRVAFLEDYDIQLAHYLNSGVDLWMNTPRPPMEASGTSGQKAALNGVPHFSTLDGWWLECYSGKNGWAIGTAEDSDLDWNGRSDDEKRDDEDAEAIYSILESEIVPLYYDRNERGVPEGWVEVMKEAIRTAGADFSSRRMMLEYLEQYYGPASQT